MLTGRNIIGAAAYQTISPKVCKTCGKTFPIANMQYAYKLTKPNTGTSFNWYCCYTCFRAAQKPLEDKQRAHWVEMERRAAERVEKDGLRKQAKRREAAREARNEAGEGNHRADDREDEKGERGKDESEKC